MLRCSNCPALTVQRVIDGDTLNTNAGRVRLFGVDAPERGEKCFREATASLKELAGGTVKVEAGPRLQDPHGRLLYYVYTSSGYSVDAILIQKGLAHAWNSDGQHRDALVDMEANARSTTTGCLWQP